MGLSLLDREKRNRWIDLGYGIGMVLFFLYFLYMTVVYFPVPYTPYPAMTWYWAAGAVVTTVLGKRWKDITFWIMLSLVLMITLRASLATPDFAEKTSVMRSVLGFVFLFFVVYAIPFALKEDRLKAFLKTLATLWILAMVILCAVGVYAAVTNTRIYNLSPERYPYKGYFGFYQGRLVLIQMCIVAAAMLCASVLMSIWCCHVTRNRFGKILYAMTVPLFLFTIGLTDSRAEFITSGFVLGAVVCVFLYHRLQNSPKYLRGRKPYGRKGLTTTLCLILGAVILVGTVLAIRGSMRAYNYVIENGVLPAAQADEEEEDPEDAVMDLTPVTATGTGQIANRSFFNADLNIMLNGRPAIWNGAFTAIRNDPTILYKGLSIYKYMKTVYPANAHCHNILLEYLITGGIPALALYLMILIPFFIRAFRLFFRPGVAMWKRLIPILPMSLFIGDMVDAMTWPKDAVGAFFWLFLGTTVALGSKKALGIVPAEDGARGSRKRKTLLKVTGCVTAAVLLAGTVFVGSGYADRLLNPTKAERFGDRLTGFAKDNGLTGDSGMRYIIYLGGETEYSEEDLDGMKTAVKRVLGTKHVKFLTAGELPEFTTKKARKYDAMLLTEYDAPVEAWLARREWRASEGGVVTVPPKEED